MADITSPQVIKFCNEVLRPLCDVLVGAKALLDAETVTYTETVLPILGTHDGADVVLDGSAEDGRTPLTRSDITAAIGVLAAIQAVAEEPGNEGKLSKPHVNLRLP